MPPSERFLTRAQALISLVTYRDWVFHLGQDAIGLYYLQLKFDAADHDTGGVESWAGRKWRLSVYMTDVELLQTALKAVLTAEEHEARERFHYRGVALFGPHLSLDALMQAAQHTEYRLPPGNDPEWDFQP